jgi:ABC-type lipoprotein export system ATPase subunit
MEEFLNKKIDRKSVQEFLSNKFPSLVPKYLFADEPTGNLDSLNGQVVMSLFKKVNQERGTTVIYVTHDQLFAQMASRQIHLKDGRMLDA